MTLPEFFGWLTTLFFNFSYVPQIYRIVKTKQTRDISLGYVWLLISAYICGLIYSTSIKAWPMVFSHCLGITGSVIILFFKLKLG